MVQIVLARILLPEDFGSLAIIVAFTGYATLFVSSGISTTVIQKQGVIALYPDGPDKNTAVQDCEKAKHKMICAIGAYDARRQELINYFKQNFEHLEGWANGTNAGTSHAIVENTYYNFYKK